MWSLRLGKRSTFSPGKCRCMRLSNSVSCRVHPLLQGRIAPSIIAANVKYGSMALAPLQDQGHQYPRCVSTPSRQSSGGTSSLKTSVCLWRLVGTKFATKLFHLPKAARVDCYRQQLLYSSFAETSSTSHHLPALGKMRQATRSIVCSQGLSSREAQVARVIGARLHHACWGKLATAIWFARCARVLHDCGLRIMPRTAPVDDQSDLESIQKLQPSPSQDTAHAFCITTEEVRSRRTHW